VGVVLFTYQKDFGSENNFDLLYGNSLLGISLLMDGFTSAAQDLMRKNSKPSTLNFMIFNNTWSSLISIVVLISTGEGTNFYFFCAKFPKVLIYLGIVVAMGFCGQFFISSIILSFGSLPCSIVTTLRKFTTVMLSIFIFKNNLTLQQWMATGIIFSALALDILFGRKKPTAENNSESIGSNKNMKIDAEKSMDVKENEKSSPQ
jgi:UDP-galactose transporter B1